MESTTTCPWCGQQAEPVLKTQRRANGTVKESEIQQFVKSRLSMHAYPKEIEFVDDVPRTPDGKLKRKALKRIEYERKGVPLPKQGRSP
jgi:acyl-coenzyme A synthetase/AMP-(fatty) acid ligase